MDTAECFWCEKEFEYNDSDTFERYDYDYEENIVTWYEIVCPYCNENTKVY